MGIRAVMGLVTLTIFGSHCQAQSDTVYHRHTFRHQFLAPAILLSTSMIAMTDNEVFDRWEIQEARQENFPHFKTSVDDYLQYAPAAAAYALDAFGVKGQHRLWPKTIMLMKSELVMVAIVFPLKHIVGMPRPDTGARDAFPSGHTAQAFAAATFFHKEYGHLSIWYSIGAYTIASSVGAMRVLNDRHWASDVLAGAGIGILATTWLISPIQKRHTHVIPICQEFF